MEVSHTVFSQEEDGNGVWRVGAEGFLYFVKTRGTAMWHVEVQVAVFVERTDQKGYRMATCFEVEGTHNGVWCLEGVP